MRRRGERRQLLIPAQVDDIHFNGLNERPLPPAGHNYRLLKNLAVPVRLRTARSRRAAALVAVQLAQFWQHSPDGFSRSVRLL